MPLFAVSSNILEKPFWSTFHNKYVHTDAVSNFLVSYQHLFFVPIIFLARFNLYAQSWILLLDKRNKTNYRVHEILSLLGFNVWLLAVALTMGSWPESVAWVLVSHIVAGCLHFQIVVAHWAMDTYYGKGYNQADDEWYRLALRTTMNITCPAILDFVHIGLQFQIEHHLYPNLPRHSLRTASLMVQKVCKKHGIEYVTHSIFGCLDVTVQALRETAETARTASRL
jgi:acyl-lipid Delta6-acetylenase / acyl-lipid (9-3)-desaturase